MVLLQLQCPFRSDAPQATGSVPQGTPRATQFVTLLAVPPHSSRQLLCPLCHFVHNVLRSAQFHHVPCLTNAHGQAIAFPLLLSFLKLHPMLSDDDTITKLLGIISTPQCVCTATAARLLPPARSWQTGTGFHYAHYGLHSFQSHSVHPLPIILLALRPIVHLAAVYAPFVKYSSSGLL
jgi:hypothetical protein